MLTLFGSPDVLSTGQTSHKNYAIAEEQSVDHK